MLLIAWIASLLVAVLVRSVFVAQFPAVRHRRHVPLLAGGIGWPHRPDIIHACANPLSPEP